MTAHTHEDLPTVAQRRVAQAAALLDTLVPGWHLNIDPNTVDVESTSRCPLTQLYNDFDHGLTELMDTSGQPDTTDLEARVVFAVEHGFDTEDHCNPLRDLADLTTAWADEIQARRWAATARPLRPVIDGDPWAGVTA